MCTVDAQIPASIAYFDRVIVFEVLRYKHFEHDNVVEISNRITFDFYPGLPHVLFTIYLYVVHVHVCLTYDV